jgi:hypothetical protein
MDEDVANMQILNVLTVVYKTQNYWGSGLSPSSSVLEKRKHVSETGSVSETSRFIFSRIPMDRKCPKPSNYIGNIIWRSSIPLVPLLLQQCGCP